MTGPLILPWYSMGLRKRPKIVVWISLTIVCCLCLMNLAGWVFDIPVLKSFLSSWKPMEAITSVCLLMSVAALVLIQTGTGLNKRPDIPKLLVVIVLIISLMTTLNYLLNLDGSMARLPVFKLFLSTSNRMSLISSLLFIFFSIILYLLSVNNNRTADFAHVLLFPVVLISYFVPLSYLLNVYSFSFHNPDIPVSFDTGVSFCALSIVILLTRPETWLMKVFTTQNLGGIMARKLLPGLLLLPILIGWLRLKGERSGIFESEIGVILVVLIYSSFFILFIWIAARSVNQIDEKRRLSDKALKKANDDLEDINRMLQKELEERILIDEVLRKSEIELKELNATKDKFFNIVAHDLKNPFTSLMGSSELLYKNIDKLDEKNIISLAGVINDSAKNGYAILQNLLDWSRSQTGLLKINPEDVNLRELINESITNLSQVSANKEIKVTSEIKDDIFVHTDKNMIRTILRNLLSNAIKFSYRKGEVAVSYEKSVTDVIIKVKDNGTGIHEDNIDKLFRIDTKYSLPGTENEMGTSIGLKLCKEFIEKLDGSIWVESAVKKGSEFKFSIPAKLIRS